MRRDRRDILITVILLAVFTGLVFLNYYSFKLFEERTSARIERHEALEAWQQERLAAREATREFIRMRELARDNDISDIIVFQEEYSAIKEEYLSSISSISKDLEEKVVNIGDINDLVSRRIDASKRFQESLESMSNIPAPLEDFYSKLMAYLENDINTWQATRSYYSGSYDGEEADLKQLHRKNSALYQQALELQKEIYSDYGLEDLL